MIPAEAVEAAERAMLAAGNYASRWEDLPVFMQRQFTRDARVALEAAALHMLAEKLEPVEALVTKGPWEPIDTTEWWKPHARSCDVFSAPHADCDCGAEIP